MKYRYYITDTLNGTVKGTDDTNVALNHASYDDYFVVDTQTGLWCTPDGQEEIKEA